MVKFSDANAKIEALAKCEELRIGFLTKNSIGLNPKVYSFDLLSGWSCPFAQDCLSKAILVDGKRKIKDGSKTKFRCFSASQEVQYTNVYNLRASNYNTLKHMHLNDMIATINGALPKDAGIVRIHVAGDFFNRDYMFAWYSIAMANPQTLFYAYTKSLRYWLDIQEKYGILSNMVFTASRGGREDYLIDKHNLREAVVVFSEQEAYDKGLEIDHDDSHAARPSLRNQSFALLIHGTQPKGSDAAVALQELKKNNVKHSYSRKATV